MSIKQNNTYFKETDSKIYYYNNEGKKTDVPSSAFGNLEDKIGTKLDTSAFEDVSGTFYTTYNPSGFIDKSVDDLTNYYTTAQTYTQQQIDEKLANFGGFEVVSLTTGEDPVPDVNEPSTKIIYLTKDDSSTKTDPYTEWIFTSADVSTTAWEVIGETTVDLSNYYTTAQTSGSQEIQDALDLKQNILTAGTDLVISNGIIGVNTNGTANSANMAFVAGSATYASGRGAAAFGLKTSAIGEGAHAEGRFYSPAQNVYFCTIASSNAAHAEGQATSAYGIASHAEGYSARAAGTNSHAEGRSTSAYGFASHAEGMYTKTSGDCSHAENYYTSAVGNNSHAEGYYTLAAGSNSHAGGYYTIASGSSTTVIGKYNSNQFAAFVIGNGSGTDVTARSDAFIVNWDGTVSAKKFVDNEYELALTGGNYVSVTEDTTNNKLVIDLESSLGQILTELSGVLTAKPSTGRHILGVDTGSLTWLEVNQ